MPHTGQSWSEPGCDSIMYTGVARLCARRLRSCPHHIRHRMQIITKIIPMMTVIALTMYCACSVICCRLS